MIHCCVHNLTNVGVDDLPLRLLLCFGFTTPPFWAFATAADVLFFAVALGGAATRGFAGFGFFTGAGTALARTGDGRRKTLGEGI